MKRYSFIDKFRFTDRFLEGKIKVILDKVVDAEGKDSVKQDGRYFEFSDGERVHCRFAEGDKVAVVMSYQNAGLDESEFGNMEGWKDKRKVNEKYMPYHFVVENVRCVRMQDITEEEALKAGLQKNAGGTYMVGGECGGFQKDWKKMFAQLMGLQFRFLYKDNPWVIVYDVKPVIGKIECLK